MIFNDRDEATIQVKVTTRFIEAGREGDCAMCPVALALKDEGVEPVSVGTEVVAAWQDGRELVGYLPIEATAFIHAFDEGKWVGPFTFPLTFSHYYPAMP